MISRSGSKTAAGSLRRRASFDIPRSWKLAFAEPGMGGDQLSRIAIRNCDVIDGTGTPAQRGMDVLVEGNRIAEVRPADRNGNPPVDGTVLIDGTGKTVMPGLIDAHCHTTYGESLTQEEQDIWTSVEGRTLRSAWNVQKVLA